MKLFALGFQDPASPIMEGIIDLHNHIMFYLVLILFFVLYMFFAILRDFYKPYALTSTINDLKLRQIMLKGNGVVHGTFFGNCLDIDPKLYFNVDSGTFVFFVVFYG
jgi:hypothetical protein